ncbi:AlpA family phage regulatory protein [Pseudomonas chengduensis]|jgi:prophage regulatory protein|nr:AlpA family phage regulatory protein [Pseudomonas chengduensis]MBG0845885.1 AlpA family phage regulatory protein [Pseudomonas chengduensis]
MAAPAQAVPNDSPRKFIKLREVKALTTLSTSELYRRIASGSFPRQVMLGPKSAVWIEAEVLAWCEARIAASRGEAA